MDFNGSLCVLIRLYPSLFVFMSPYKSFWVLVVLMGPYRGPFASIWVFMGPYKFLCVFMNSNGFLWVCIVIYASL